jgi:hypothetical protein
VRSLLDGGHDRRRRRGSSSEFAEFASAICDARDLAPRRTTQAYSDDDFPPCSSTERDRYSGDMSVIEELDVPETQVERIPVGTQLRMLQEKGDLATIEMPPLFAEGAPVPVEDDPTMKNRDPIATILGIAPLPPMKVLAAPALVPTENVARLPLPMLAPPRPVDPSSWLGWCVAGGIVATLLATMLVFL